MDAGIRTYMDLAVLQCLNMIPNEYFLALLLVEEKPLAKRAENVLSRVRGSDPRVNSKQLAGHSGPTRG